VTNRQSWMVNAAGREFSTDPSPCVQYGKQA